MTRATDYTDGHGQSTGSGGDQGPVRMSEHGIQTQPVGMIRRYRTRSLPLPILSLSV
jgi:hypothetical protein